MMIDMKGIGAYIQSRRKSRKLTQEELGERLGVTAQSVSNGTSKPRDRSNTPYRPSKKWGSGKGIRE